MKSVQYIICCLLFSISLHLKISAQGEVSPNDYPAIFHTVDSFLRKYIDYSKFEVQDGNTQITTRQFTQFKSLFLEDATLDDELCPKYFDDIESENKIKIADYDWLKGVTRSLNDYCDKRKKYFENEGCYTRVKNISISYNALKSGLVTVLIEKEVEGYWTARELTIKSTPVLELELLFSNNYKDIKIKTIKFANKNLYAETLPKSPEEEIAAKTGKPVRYVPNEKPIRNYRIVNDPDYDFRAKRDFAPELPGFVEKNEGAPSDQEKSDLKALGFNFEAPWNIDVSFNYGLPNYTTEASDGLTSFDDRGSWNELNKPLKTELQGMSIGIDALFNYYFGTEKNFGVGLGVGYTRYSGTIASNDFSVAYRDTLPKTTQQNLVQTYRRELGIANMRETYSGGNVNIPILVRWKPRIKSNRLILDISAGMIYQFALTGTSNSSEVRLNYGGSFNYAGVNEGWQYSTEEQDYDFRFTESNLANKQVSDFAQNDMPGLFGVGIRPSEAQNSYSLQGGIAWIFRPSLFYKLSTSYAIGLQASFMQGSWKSSDDKETNDYKPSDVLGEYFTLFKSIKKVDYQTVMISLSLRYTIAN